MNRTRIKEDEAWINRIWVQVATARGPVSA
jgi:hypothetical protein